MKKNPLSLQVDLEDFLPHEIIPDFQERIEQRKHTVQGGK